MLEQLCQLACTIIENRKTTHDEEWNYFPIFSFLEKIVEIHGGDLDRCTRLSLNSENTGSAIEERACRVGDSLESVLLTTVEAVHTLLGSIWTNAQRQGNGQPAYESKSLPVDHASLNVSNAALACTLSLLKGCMIHCPVFLLHLPAAKDQDRNEDLLFRRAVESAVASILDLDGGTSTTCMEFLETSIQTATDRLSSDPVIQHTIEEILSRVRQDMLNSLILGICGKFGSGSALLIASRLLHRLLRTYSANENECRCNLETSLSISNDYFWLGSRARIVVCDCLFRCCQGRVTLEELQELMEYIWDLHHSDSSESLPESDSVGRFCLRYSVSMS